MSLWQPTFESVFANLIAAVVVYFLIQARKLVIHLGTVAAAINDRWGLRLAQQDLVQLQACVADRQEVFHFALIRVGYWVTMLSAGLLLSTLAFIGHAMFVAPFVFLIGVALYLIAVQTTGLIYWSRNPDKFVPILQGRVNRILARMEARQARKSAPTL